MGVRKCKAVRRSRAAKVAGAPLTRQIAGCKRLLPYWSMFVLEARQVSVFV
jgi:hypothetical protein